MFLATLMSLTLAAFSWDGYSERRFHRLSEVDLPEVQAASEAVVSFEGGSGSGFLISAEGYILTSLETAEAFGSWGVVLRGQDGQHRPEALEVQLVATNPTADIALYRAHTDHPLPFLSFREARPEVGEPLFIISHPTHNAQRVSFGTVSAPIRPIGGVPSVQYRALIGWASTGAPVLDANGEVVAIHRNQYFDERSQQEWTVGVPVIWFRSLPWIPEP